jgi:1-acyl-sn-glycerol-3-phosphate acyltransferase
MIYLRSFAFNMFFFPWTVLIVLGAIIGVFLPHIFTIYIAQVWGRVTHFLLRILIGVTYEIRGQENWDGKPAIFACKHQSILETTMIQVLAFNSVIILKRELTWIPLFGQAALRSGIIAIDRSKGRRVITQLIEGARKYLQKGRSIFIFPEGTRVSPKAPTRLKAGIAALYAATGVQVIPVALNTGHIWSRRSFLKKPGKIIYQILPPIKPGMEEQEFIKHLENVIESACQQINRETQNGRSR